MADGTLRADWFSTPGTTVRALMARRALSTEALAARLACGPEAVRGLLTGVRAIDRDLAGRLAEAVGGTESFWLRRQSQYESMLDRAAGAVPGDAAARWLGQLPLAAMRASGWLDRGTSRPEALRACMAYFGVTGPGEWRTRYAGVAADSAFRTSPSFESGLGPLSAWLRQAEIEASLAPCASWDPRELKRRLPEFRKLTLLRRPSAFLPRLRAGCAAAGVALVVLKAPPGCRASGAARFVAADRAVIVLSFRHLAEDHLWFTFFHEVGHLLLHSKAATFVDSGLKATDAQEREANDFAATLLVPTERQDELLRLAARREAVLRFATSVGISPGIVVGQMQHQGVIGPDQLNFLKRRYDWTEIQAAA